MLWLFEVFENEKHFFFCDLSRFLVHTSVQNTFIYDIINKNKKRFTRLSSKTIKLDIYLRYRPCNRHDAVNLMDDGRVFGQIRHDWRRERVRSETASPLCSTQSTLRWFFVIAQRFLPSSSRPVNIRLFFRPREQRICTRNNSKKRLAGTNRNDNFEKAVWTIACARRRFPDNMRPTKVSVREKKCIFYTRLSLNTG